MQKRPFLRVLFTILLAIIWLLGYPYLHSNTDWLQQNFRQYGPIPIGPDSTSKNGVVQTSDTLALADSLTLRDTTPIVLASPAPRLSSIIPPLVGTYSGISALDSFFAALNQPQKQIRIAYYGDSSIEGDLICMTFRDSLQRRFGGHGVGFVPITSHITGFRRSVRHHFSDNWYRNVIGETNDEKLLRGISGEYFLPQIMKTSDSLTLDTSTYEQDSYWASFRGSRWFPGTKSFSKARFFYGRSQYEEGQPRYSQMGVQSPGYAQTFRLNGTKLVNELTVLDTLSPRIRLQFSNLNRTPLYGISLESSEGVIVDNFACRGNSGYDNLGISSAVLTAFQEKLDYDLIILQYGLNVINPKVESFDWYERQFVRVIEHFQKAMPGVSILVVGVPDKGTKINGKIQTDPSVPRVTNTQRRVAEKTGVAFFSYYEAMGGPGSMVKWVDQITPRLANTDYTHFNFKGARKASDLLLDFLLGAYAKNAPEPTSQAL